MSSHWRKRWFVADHHYLFYYKGPNVSADSARNCFCVDKQKFFLASPPEFKGFFNFPLSILVVGYHVYSL